MNSDGPEKNFSIAFAGESRNAARAEVFAQKAQREDQPVPAHLLRAVAESRRVHAGRLLMLLRGKIGTTWAEVAEQFVAESREALDLYGRLINDPASSAMAKKTFEQFRGVEARNLAAFAEAARGQAAGREYWVCQVCGHLAEQPPVEACPVCGAIPTKFERVE